MNIFDFARRAVITRRALSCAEQFSAKKRPVDRYFLPTSKKISQKSQYMAKNDAEIDQNHACASLSCFCVKIAIIYIN
jgi:hypothetical protein